MNRPSLTDRMRYWFDNTMSRGPIALIGWLGLLAGAVIVATSLVVFLIGRDSQASLGEQVWAFLMLTLEPDAITFGHWTFRLATLVIVFTSVFVLSSLIGVLTTGIDAKLEELRKGRSKVIEANHTVILGWSSQVFPIISELVVANENQRSSCVVVLADKPKVEMEDEIREKVGDSRRTRIVCRHGQPMDPADLEIANLATSKSIIVLAPEGSDKDTTVIKTLLAIVKGNGSAGLSGRIVAELAERKNLEVANIVTSGQSELMLSGELIARITAQTCRQSGLSVIYGDLLDFAGDEIYFQAEPSLVGQTFGEALHAFDDSAIIGLRPAGGPPLLNPPMDTRLSAGDELIAISQDDDTVAANATLPPAVDESLIQPAGRRPRAPEHTLLLGWNHRASVIIEELDRYIAPGSQLTLLADSPLAEVELTDLTKRVQRMACHFSPGDTTDRTVLDGLDLAPVDHVIVLANTRNRSQQQADAATLVTLLHLRDIADRHDLHFSIVSEILDIRTRDLAEGPRADDFIVSDRLASLVLAQVSENRQLGAVFADLFGPSGSEIYLRPVADYVAPGVEMTFHTVVEAARRRGQVAIGYRVKADSRQPARNYGVVLNPVKSERVAFVEGDQVVVLAEE